MRSLEGVEPSSRARRRSAGTPRLAGARGDLEGGAAGERAPRESAARRGSPRARARMRASKPSPLEQPPQRRRGRRPRQRAVRAGDRRRAAPAPSAAARGRVRARRDAASRDHRRAREDAHRARSGARRRGARWLRARTIGHPSSNGRRKGEHAIVEVCGREVRVSNPGKLFFPGRGSPSSTSSTTTSSARRRSCAHLRERPTVMKRWVDGVEGEPFFQKRVPDSAPEWLADRDGHLPQRPPRARARAQRRRPPGLGREPRRDRLEPLAGAPLPISTTPTSCASTSIPGPGVPFAEVREVALGVREVLDEHGLLGFPKTSGSRGHPHLRAHRAEQSFEEVRRAALALAREVERRMPGRATSRWWKEEREGVFIDYNQNARDRTVASAYSVRAVPDARVSCPLEWDEVADVEPARAAPGDGPGAAARARRPLGAIDEHAGRLDGLLELAARDEREGLGDAPWPPHFRKQQGRARARAAEPAPAARAGGRAMSLPLAPPLKPQLALSRKELPDGRGLLLRGQARRLPLPGLRRRRGDLPAVAQRPAARPLLPRARAARRALRARRRDRRARRRRAARTSTRSASASTRRPRASSGSPSETPAVYVAFDLLAPRTTSRCSSGPSPSAAPRSRRCSPASAFARRAVELMPTRRDAPRRPRRWLAARRGRDRQGALRALPPGRAQGDGQGQARAHDRRRRRRLAPGQGAGHRRRADPRPLRRRRAARRRALLGAQRGREAPAGRLPRAV